jgi:hypothetical protein
VIKQERRYISYLLRMWQGGCGSERVWRASLESPHTGERWGFASPADLFAFMEREIRGVAASQAAPHAKEKKSGDSR